MKTIAEIIKAFKLKLAFEKHNIAPDTLLKMGEAKTKDGAVVMFPGDMPMVGDPAGVMLPGEAEPVQAPEGKHELEDGTVIVVDATGMIVEVIAPAATSDDPPAQDKPIDAAQAKKIIESIVKETEFSQAVKDVFASVLEEAVKPLKDENDALKAKIESLEQFSNQTFAIVDKIAKQPAAAPIEKQKQVMSSTPKTDKVVERKARIFELINKELTK